MNAGLEVVTKKGMAARERSRPTFFMVGPPTATSTCPRTDCLRARLTVTHVGE